MSKITFDKALSDACLKTNKEDMELFIAENNKFWSSFPEPSVCNGNILVEETGEISYTNHQLAVGSLILNRAKAYKPLWIDPKIDVSFFKSYVSSADKVTCKIRRRTRRRLNFIAWFEYIKMFSKKDILNFKYDGVYYGDLLYDHYLRSCYHATFKKKDKDFFNIIYNIMLYHEMIKRLIKENDIKAVLISQQVGLTPCVLHRVAIKMNLKSYLLSDIWFYKFDKMKEYQLTPKPEEIRELLSLPDKDFNKLYKKVNELHFSGYQNIDAKCAFGDSNKYYSSREEFCRDYNLDPTKKNIFIMLHVFNDYPHSHFNFMLFDDYYDWFIKTLEYAKKDESVNWIVKQHPTNARYICNDVNYDEIFKDVRGNIKYLGLDVKLDSRSMEHIADAVITCIGSAGYDVPAMYGIPSVIAGDNFYMGYDFTTYPKTQKEYFSILADLKNVSKISAEAQRQARAIYIFVLYCARVNNFTNIDIKYKVDGDFSTLDWSLKGILANYADKKDLIFANIKDIIQEVSKSEFKAYRTDYRKLLKETNEVNSK